MSDTLEESSVPNQNTARLQYGIGYYLWMIILYGSWFAGNVYATSILGEEFGGRLLLFTEQTPVAANIVFFVACCLVAALSAPIIFYLEKAGSKGPKALMFFAVLLLLLPLFIVIVVGFFRLFVIGWNVGAPAFRDAVETYGLRIPVFVGILIGSFGASYGAYLARTFKRISYGLVELLFGLGSVLYAVYSVMVTVFVVKGETITNTEVWQASFGFLAGVYVIVRGLANIEDGLNKQPLTPRKIGELLLGLLARWREAFFVTRVTRSTPQTNS
jgi:hypothetical protein